MLNANGGGDNIVASDLTGTADKQVTIDLGAGDGQADVVWVDATAGNDLDQHCQQWRFGRRHRGCLHR